MKSKNTGPKIKGTVFLDAMHHLEIQQFSCHAITSALGLRCSEKPKERVIYEDLFELDYDTFFTQKDVVFKDEGERIIALQLAYEVLNGKSYGYLENPSKKEIA